MNDSADPTQHDFSDSIHAPLGAAEVKSRAIGELIRDARNLSAEDVEHIARYQREHNVRFGEAAIALGLASAEDVLYALSQQFQYAYGDEQRRQANPELVALVQPFGHQAEAFRAIRSQILLRSQEEEGGQRRPLAVVSLDSGDGKTYFCANLAVALAQLGGRVLVVDADMRGARLHQIFDVDNSRGLSNLLAGRGGKNVVKAVPDVPNLWVMPVGPQPPNPLELVEGPAFGLLLRELSSKFDHVIIDTPAAVFGTDGVVIAARCGAALVVARRDASRVSGLQDLVVSLQAGHTRLAGVVMNEY
ncbi:MAG: polysaccharide biosynthesis tyrosine autokinase [Burkholderiales bacterium]|jgi:chain length determinant protein tyrosine kinase EpsG|nr:polysaccharide biosynthesis tyrosine autokinase [Burkholderiales bacterium]